METAVITVGAVLVVAFPAFLALGRTYSLRHQARWPDGAPIRSPRVPADGER